MENKKLTLLKVALIVFAFQAILFGFFYAFIPQVSIEASGSDPVPSGWLRWSGAVLIAIGLGSILVIRKPKNQGIFVLTMALGTLLCGLALMYSSLFEPAGIGNVWHTVVPGLINLFTSLLLWIGLKQAKNILW